jgi:hypothetical protein
MSSLLHFRFPFGLSAILVIALAHITSGQNESKNQPSQPAQNEAKLTDEFGNLGSEERSARFDIFFQEIQRSPESIGYVFLYCGKKCRYGEIEAHLRGIELKTAIRKFNRSRLVIVNAGFRDDFVTELWLVAKGQYPPTPRSTVNIKYVVFAERRKYLIEAYDCCDDFSEIWKNYKP